MQLRWPWIGRILGNGKLETGIRMANGKPQIISLHYYTGYILQHDFVCNIFGPFCTITVLEEQLYIKTLK